MGANLTGKVALVVGASRGIGAGVARAFAAAGAAVVVASRDEASLERLAAELRAAGSPALAVPADVTDPPSVERLVARVLSEYGHLDAACNNAAGGGHPPTPLADVALEAFDSAVETTLRGVFLALRAEIPAMLANGGGAVVNTSSTAGVQAVGGLAAYVAAKHGVEGLTRVAALDYARGGVRVNAVAPGPILAGGLERAGEAGRAAAAAALPLGRVGTVEEVASAVVWLCSDDAAFVTGTTLVLDGGKLAGSPPFQRG